MKGIMRVIYWQRSGLKVYKVNQDTAPVIEKEIVSGEVVVIEEGLKFLAGESVYLLLADSISYLYEKVIDPPMIVDNNFKGKLLDLVKADIPEDFGEFDWDYKVEKEVEGKQKVKIFAPIKEFQTMISQIAKTVGIKIVAIETESVAVARDPNPVVGIVMKDDIGGKDEETLNLSVIPTAKKRSILIDLMGVVGMTVMTLILLFLVLKFGTRKASLTKVGSIPTAVKISVNPTAKPVVIGWADLRIMVQNGTTKSGLAGKTATIFTKDGVKRVETGNADRDDYEANKLIFKDNLIKENYLEKIKKLVTVTEANVEVDNKAQYDVIFILGNN